jgi:hypothetical protein
MRFDFVFSYWIFAWYLLYIAKMVSYNPKLALGLGIIENAFLLVSMVLFGSNARTILSFIFINTLIKVLPYYSLRRETIRTTDLLPTVFLFAVYVGWIYYNQQDLTGNYKKVFDSLIHNRDETPFMKQLYNFYTFAL